VSLCSWSFKNLFFVSFNISATDVISSVSSCWYSLNNWSTNVSLSQGGGDSWFGSEGPLVPGNFTARFACNDSFDNENSSAFSNFHYELLSGEVAAYFSGVRGNVSFNYTYILNASVLTGRGDSVLELWFNNSFLANLSGSGNFSLQNVTPVLNWDEAPYNFTAVYTGNSNISGTTETWWVNLPNLGIELPVNNSVIGINPFNLKLSGSGLTPGNCTYNLSNAVSKVGLGSELFSFPRTTVRVPGSVVVSSELNVSVSCNYGFGTLERSVEFSFVPLEGNQWVGIFLILFIVLAGLCLLLGTHFDSVMFSFVGAIVFLICGLYIVIYGLPFISSVLFENVIGYSVLLLGAYLIVRVGLDFISSVDEDETDGGIFKGEKD